MDSRDEAGAVDREAEFAAAARSPSMRRGVDVLLVANVKLFREGLAAAMASTSRLKVAAVRGSFEVVAAHLRERPPDVVLLDMAIPGSPGLISLVLEKAPETRLAALGTGEPESEVVACAALGVHGYVEREASLDELVSTVEGLVRDEMPCSPRIAATLMRQVTALSAARRRRPAERSLTRRQAEVLELVAAGFSNKRIAAQLHIEVPTVKHHVHNIFEKLRVHTRAEAVAQIREVQRVQDRV